MRTINTSIDIGADPETVWSVLMDFPSYPDWNPFVIDVIGTAAVGERLAVRLQPPGGKAMTFKPRVTEVVDQRFFQWLGKLGFKGIFDGRHSFRINPTEHGVRFEHSEQFTGILAGLMIRMIGERTEAGFRAMNEAIKARAEAARAG